jgi:Ca-activated chloride channel family protein
MDSKRRGESSCLSAGCGANAGDGANGRNGTRGARHGQALQAVFVIVVFWALALPVLCRADGFIVVNDPPRPLPGHFSFAPLEVSFHRVSVTVTDLIATTTVDEEFYNPSDRRLEGTYIFPLPEGSHIDRFSMDINGRMMEAELLPADKARALYEEIVRKAMDPALLEYVGRGAFKLRIFPIEPGSRKRVKISYSQLLRSDAGLVEYVYPLNTEKFSASPVRDVSVTVTLDGKDQLKSVYCPTHAAEIRRDGERRAVVGWEARNVWPDTDFKVLFSRKANPVGIDLLASRSPGGDGYFMLLASPGISASKGSVAPKDICFVLDTSGSMAGAKLDQAKKALAFCLANLNPGDAFEIIRFSTEAEAQLGGLVPATKANLDRARQFVDGFTPIGGTAIGDALARALALRPRGAGNARPYMIVFLTDGLPTVGETQEDRIVDQVIRTGSPARVFSFGIGTDVNTHLLDRIADETRAVSQYVLPNEDIELKVSSFYTKIREPVLSNLTLSFTNPRVRITQVLPKKLPDLFNGDMLVVFGKYSGRGPSAARITGTFNGTPHEFTADVSFPESESDNPFIPRLWATRRVGALLDEIRLHGESAELRDEVVSLAREFGIVTPYTAYLILEDEAGRGVPAPLRTFQELEDDGAARDAAKSAMESVRREAKSEESRSGRIAVDNSIAVQDLRTSTTLGQAARPEGLAKLLPSSPVAEGAGGYKAAQTRNYAQQVRVVNGRAFYQNGTTWTDSTAQSKRGLANRVVRFGSEEYFQLVKKNPQAAQWLALGDTVDVVVGDTLIQVRR